MSMRRLAFAACAAALIASPAAAQTAAELVGSYRLSIMSKTGSDCPSDDETQPMDFNVNRIAGDKLVFGMDREEETAEYHSPSMSFRFEQAVRDGVSGEQSGVLTGRFSRLTDAVRLDITIAIKGCTMTAAGMRPAPVLALGPTPPPDMPLTEPPTGAAPPAPGPGNTPAGTLAAVASSGWMNNWVLVVAGTVLVLLVGAWIGMMLGRRKPAEDKPEDENPGGGAGA